MKSREMYKSSILKKITIIGLAFSVAMATPAFAQIAPLAEGVAAIVNDEPITSFDVKQRTRYLLIRQRIAQPTNEIIAQATQAALNSLINEKLQIQEAKKFKLEMSDAEVDKILQNQAAQNGGTLQDLFNDLNAAGLSINSYRNSTRAEVLWQRIVVGRYGNRVKISAERINEAIARIQSSANLPQYQVSEIFIESDPLVSENETLQGVQTLVTKIRGGENFAGIAETYSYSTSAATGGNLGWVLAGELRPEVSAIIDTIPLNQASNPIKVDGGYMIILVAGKHQPDGLSTNYMVKELSKKLSANASESQIKKAESQLIAAHSQLKGTCNNIEKTAKANDVIYTDLGIISDAELNAQSKAEFDALDKGKASPINKTANGLSMTIMCDKTITGEGIPTYAQIEDNLHDQELSLIARRYLRDIRREAAIVTR